MLPPFAFLDADFVSGKLHHSGDEWSHHEHEAIKTNTLSIV